jgi:cation diffusion facilitator family transporter
MERQPTTPRPHTKNDHDHGHSHGRIDPSITASDRGIWAVKWSFIVLFLGAAIQLAIVLLSNSVSLLADTIHNFGDAGTAIPLGIAFLFGKKKPTQRFSYGYGRFEDFAGIVVVLIIFASAVMAAYEAIRRLIHPELVTHLGAIVAASLIGFVANEAVAVFRIKVGSEIGSAALIADGYHARTDGWTSLAVLFGALGVYFGYPKADPIIGLLITIAILGIVYQSAKDVMLRALDGVEPQVLEDIRHAAGHVQGVKEVTEVRARWLGHQLLAELNIAVAPELSVADAHRIATEVHSQLLKHLTFLTRATVHVDAVGVSGEHFHFETSQIHEHNDEHHHGHHEHKPHSH